MPVYNGSTWQPRSIMDSMPIVKSKVGSRRFNRVLLILSTASIIVPLSNQNAAAASWAVEKLENYQLHPDWVNRRCENMERVNQHGLSNFTEKVALLEKDYNPNFSTQNTKEIIEFYHLFGRKFCTTAW